MKKYCVSIVVLLFSYLSSSGQVIQLSEKESYYGIGKYLKIYEDTTGGKISFEQISSPAFADKFTQNTKEVPSFGTSASAFWAKFEVQASEEVLQDKRWLLNLETTEVGEAELFRLDSEGRLLRQKISAFEPFDKRAIQHRFYVFPGDLAGGKNVFYLKIKFDFLSSIPLSISTLEEHNRRDHDDQSVFGILYGMLLVMVFYNLFLFVYLREKMYLLYSLYILVYTAAQMQVTNYAFENLWPHYPEWNRMALIVTISLSQIVSVYFSKLYLNINKFLPKSKIVFSFVVWLTGIWCSAAVIAYYGFGLYIGQGGIMLAAAVYMFLLIIAPILVIKKGYKPAVFFLIAWLFVVAGGQISFFRQTGLLPVNDFTNHAGLVGFVLETVLLAFGLAFKINLMREEIKRKEIEKERLKREEEEKRNVLIRKQNEELEGKVVERTSELESANRQLHEINEEVLRQNAELYKKSEKIELQKLKLEENKEEMMQQNEEMQQQNEELIAVSERLQEQNMQVSIKNIELEKQHRVIENAHRDIQASINYAKRIQLATLPRAEFIHKLFPEHFILYQPRDTVSGDFYWAAQVTEVHVDPKNPLLTKNGRKLKVLVTADCTGHGVPGALMSMIGSNILDQSVKDRKITEPGIILRTMDYAVKILLKQNTGDNRDGMDASVLTIDDEQKKVYFAGAKRPLVYLKNNELVNLKGSSASVGGENRRADKNYESHTISYADSPIMLYTFSDGYTDQIGGPNDKKYMIKAFRNVLHTIHHESMNKQKAVLEKNLADWTGRNRQLDDILVVGLRLDAGENKKTFN